MDEEQGVVVLTRLGYEASDALYRSLPLYARERALKGALGLLARLERKAAISTRTVEQDGKFIAPVHVDGSRRRAVENGIVHAVL